MRGKPAAIFILCSYNKRNSPVNSTFINATANFLCLWVRRSLIVVPYISAKCVKFGYHTRESSHHQALAFILRFSSIMPQIEYQEGYRSGMIGWMVEQQPF